MCLAFVVEFTPLLVWEDTNGLCDLAGCDFKSISGGGWNSQDQVKGPKLLFQKKLKTRRHHCWTVWAGVSVCLEKFT